MTPSIRDVENRLRNGIVIDGFHPEHFKVIRDLILASDSHRILVGRHIAGDVVDHQMFPTKDAIAVIYGRGESFTYSLPGVWDPPLRHSVVVDYRDGERRVVYEGNCLGCTRGTGHIAVAREICRLPPFDGRAAKQLALRPRIEERVKRADDPPSDDREFDRGSEEVAGKPEQAGGMSEEISVFYAGGFAGYQPKGGFLRQAWTESWWLTFDERGVKVELKKNQARSPTTIRFEAWNGLRSVSLESGGSARESSPLAAFGLLRMGSSYTVISILYADGLVVFFAMMDSHQARLFVDSGLRSWPDAEGVLSLGPPPTGAERAVGAPNPQKSNSDGDMSIADQLERLNAMHLTGQLTDEEYGVAKRKVLGMD